MSKSLTLGSFFDGIGGWLLAAKHAGVNPVWASEIDDFPAAVSAHHFPQVKQLGDITKINVDELEPVDIICAGSPCQDLSIAGKREGLAGERSGLFRTAGDIVRQMRVRTNGKYPRFFVWENVPGAFSSNHGRDFQTVLAEIGQTDVPMPQSGRWATAGMVRTQTADIAWRVLDAQFWGVPQRRKRIFLIADFAATDRRAAEILFVESCLSRDIAEGEGTGQEATGNVGESVDSASETLTPWDVQSNRIQGINGKAAALYGGAGQGTHNGAVFDTRRVAYSFDSLASNSMKSKNPHSGCRQVEVSKTLDTTIPDPSKNQGGIAIYDMTHANEVIRTVNGDKTNTLNSRMGTGGNQVPIVHSYCIAGNTIDRQPKNGGNGAGNQEELSYTLNTVDRHAVAECFPQNAYDKFLQGPPLTTLKACGGSYGGGSESLIAEINHYGKVRRLTPTECERLQGLEDSYRQAEGSEVFREKADCLTATYGTKWNGNAAATNGSLFVKSGKSVRRLTPTECEKLQGLPDGYTDIEFNGKPAPDSRRYKAIGNGMAQPVADFVIRRIAEVVSNEA